MKPPEEGDPLWIFIHIPKCGGTTFKAHVERYVPIEEQFFEFSNWGRKYRAERGLPDFANRSESERAQARVLAGHNVSYGIHRLVTGNRQARYISVLRDPAERCISLYNYLWSRGQAPDDFGEWYRHFYRLDQSNFQTRFLAEKMVDAAQPEVGKEQLRMAIRLLEKCWFVTTTDEWNEGLDLVFSEMGLPGDWTPYRKAGASVALPESHPARGEIIERRFVPDIATRAEIGVDSPFDAELVAWVRSNASRWPANGIMAEQV